MKKQYKKPCSRNVVCYEPLIVKESFGEGEASRESKFGTEESDTEEHENFWDE